MTVNFFFTKLFFSSDLFVREGVKLGMVIFEIRFPKKYDYSCPKTQCYPFITPQYMRNEKFTLPDFWNICEIKIPRELQLGMPRGTRGTLPRVPRLFFSSRFPGEYNLAPHTCPPFPRKGTVLTIFFIFKKVFTKKCVIPTISGYF